MSTQNEVLLDIAILTVRMARGFGVDVVVDQQARRLSECGHRITVYCIEHEPAHYVDPPYEITKVGGNLRHLAGMICDVGHDAVIAHSSPFFELLPLIVPATRCVAYEHGDPTPALFPVPKRLKRHFIKSNKLHNVYPHVDRVFAISNFIAKDIGWPSATIIPNGADHLVVSAGPVAATERRRRARERFGVTKNERLILSVCRLGRGEANYKGLDLFLEMKTKLASVPGLRFALVGKGNEAERSELEAAGINVALNASNEELIDAYCGCDVFVSFSKWEGFNLPLVEAQAFGRPAFALDVCSHPEVCANVAGTIDEIAERICDMDESELASAAVIAKQHVANFTWARNVEELQGHLRALAASEKRAPAAGGNVRRSLYKFFLWLYLNRWNAKGSETQEPKPGLAPPRPSAIQPRHDYKQGLTSVCVLTKDRLDLIGPCMEALRAHTPLNQVEVLIGDTGTTDPEVRNFYKGLKEPFEIIELGHYHFSANNNELAARAKGEFVLFLNNDTAVKPGWFKALLAPLKLSRVAASGPRMLFRDGTIQHAGAEIFTRRPHRYVGWHPYAKLPADEPVANVHRSMPGVTGAGLLIKHQVFDEAGGFDEGYNEECQDMDLCLRLRSLGHEVIYAPTACMYHYENGTRTLKESKPDRLRFKHKWKRYIDLRVFPGRRQSKPWVPAICLVLPSPAAWPAKYADLKAFADGLPPIALTIKVTADAEAGYVMPSGLAASVRVLDPGDEDNQRYDHVLS